jgi:hypothetical protein
MPQHPIRLVVTDDLRRSRLTVFFRLLLAIPHYLWFALWTVAAVLVTVVNWVATLSRGRPPDPLHRFLASYLRYSVHLFAYLCLIADPYPPFTGTTGTYPIDLEIDPPAPQRRVVTAARIVLALPAVLVAGMLDGGLSSAGDARGVLSIVAFFGWFACLVRGRMPEGMRNLGAYGIRYGAQTAAYLLLLTDRYPDSSPAPDALPLSSGDNPIRLTDATDARQSRLMVFFRILLAVPHVVWLALWGVVAIVAAILNWLMTLVRGTPPARLHGFLVSYLRYQLHVSAFVYLAANPFPGFGGRVGTYPVDLDPIPVERQSRWITAFRIVLVLPALMLAGALSNFLTLLAILTWFAALITGRAPEGMHRASCFVLRYVAQVGGYLLILTERYPFSGPWSGPQPAAGPDDTEEPKGPEEPLPAVA